MLQRITASTGGLADVMTMDVDHKSEDNAKACAKGIVAYIATARMPHGQQLQSKRGPLPTDDDVRSKIARKILALRIRWFLD
jgi:hypothetical protein